MRCYHSNCNFIEHLDAVSTWEFRSAELVNSTCDAALNGAITVECYNCFKTYHFGRHAKLPKWVKALQTKVFNRNLE